MNGWSWILIFRHKCRRANYKCVNLMIKPCTLGVYEMNMRRSASAFCLLLEYNQTPKRMDWCENPRTLRWTSSFLCVPHEPAPKYLWGHGQDSSSVQYTKHIMRLHTSNVHLVRTLHFASYNHGRADNSECIDRGWQWKWCYLSETVVKGPQFSISCKIRRTTNKNTLI